MVQDTGKTTDLDSCKPVNTPEPVSVQEGQTGNPSAVKIKRRQAVIAAIMDKWRVDDEWWRSDPVSRLYYALRLDSGQRLVLYKDLADGHWYRQRY